MYFPNLKAAKELYIDLETKDPNLRRLGPGWCRRDGRVVGVAVGADDLPASYYPIAHEGHENLDRDSVLRWVQDAVLRGGCPIGGHNIGYDIGWLLAEGLELPHDTRLIDSMIGAPLLNEDLPHYSLSALGKLWLNEDKAEEGINEYADEHRLDPKADLWRMPPEVVGPYACQDVDLTARLIRWERGRVEEDGERLGMAWDLEMSLIPLSILMRWRGIRLDLGALDRAAGELRLAAKAAKAECKARFGVDLDPWKSASVGALLESVGIKVPRLASGRGFSIRRGWLEGVDHEAARLVLRVRKFEKAVGTFIKGWQEHVVDGRIHPEWHQARSDDGGAISFRYSCSNPNLQQVPERDQELAAILRPLFLPEPGESLYSLDYSQQEPRLLVHFAALLKLEGAVEAALCYRTDPHTDFHQMAVELTGEVRKIAKQLNLGVIYGMGKKSLAAKIGATEQRVSEIIATYRAKMPFMYGMAGLCSRLATDRGWIQALCGHKRRFDLWEPAGFRPHNDDEPPLPREEAERFWPGQRLQRAYSYTGLNALIQTSAAGQMKTAMRDVFAAGIIPTLQIHDELLISGDAGTAASVSSMMVEAVPLSVPVVVDQASGSSWWQAGDCDTKRTGKDETHRCKECNHE